MANDQLVLQINKINVSPDKSYVKYNQNERGKVIDINVIDNDGINAYDLTNKKIRFVDDKEDNKLVLDDEADNPGHFTRTADAQGKFSYIFHDLVYQRSGIARFEIYTDSEHIDATANFEIQIENTGSLVAANESYISSLEGLVAHYHRTVDTTVSETQQLINSLTDKINQAISNGQKSIADELTDAQKKLQALLNRENSLIQNWTAKVAEIESNADTQKKAIQKAADDQLKANKNANDAEIADVKKQLADELAKAEADKTTAIQGITEARDKAISDATDKLNANLRSLQEDYNTWKTSAVGDFQAKLDKLTRQLNTDETDQANLKRAIDSAKEAVSKLHDVDFTVYAHKSDLENYYTKAELDPKIAEAGKVKTVNNVQPDSSGNINIDLSGLETKADAKKALDTKSEEITALRTENNNLKQEVGNLKNKNAELEQEIKDSEIPTFNTLSEYQLWAKDHPNRLAYVLDDTK